MRATTDYAIRMMTALAASERIMSSTEISETTGVPQKYLIKIASVLRGSGLISAHHGYSGGYCLARPAGDIAVWEILSCVDPECCVISDGAQSADKDPGGECGDAFHLMFDDINERLQAYFEAVTLSDLITKEFHSGSGRKG